MSNPSSIIPFDSGKSYVIRGEPAPYQEFRFTDQLGRTEEDRRFIDQYERIFLAAAYGDLAECQRIVETEGFRDFKATSHGRFGINDNKYLNGITLMEIAQMKGHILVVNYFKKVNEEAQQKKESPKFPEGKLFSNTPSFNEDEELSDLFEQVFPEKLLDERKYLGFGVRGQNLLKSLDLLQKLKTNLSTSFHGNLFPEDENNNNDPLEEGERLKFEECLLHASLGDHEAIFELAQRYARGEGCEQNPKLAYNQMKKVTNPEGKYCLACFEEAGFGTKKNPIRSALLINNLCDQEAPLPEALFCLAQNHFNGNLVEKDFEAAAEYCNSAAELKHAKAEALLGYFKLFTVPFPSVPNEDEKEIFKELGISFELPQAKPFDSEAIVTLLIKAEKKECTAEELLKLSECYELGRGTGINPKSAFTLCKLSADLGLAKAQFRLGNFCANGYGIPTNASLAFKYTQLAAEQKDPEALGFLAHYYSIGYGVTQDPKKAFECAQASADLESWDSQYYLACWCAVGFGTEKNEKLAFDWCKKSADAGDEQAEFELANYYAKGFGTEPNIEAAIEYCKRADEHGHFEAAIWLDIFQAQAKGLLN